MEGKVLGADETLGTNDGSVLGELESVGRSDGNELGNVDGSKDGSVLGSVEGDHVGPGVGRSVGMSDAVTVGSCVSTGGTVLENANSIWEAIVWLDIATHQSMQGILSQACTTYSDRHRTVAIDNRNKVCHRRTTVRFLLLHRHLLLHRRFLLCCSHLCLSGFR